MSLSAGYTITRAPRDSLPLPNRRSTVTIRPKAKVIGVETTSRLLTSPPSSSCRGSAMRHGHHEVTWRSTPQAPKSPKHDTGHALRVAAECLIEVVAEEYLERASAVTISSISRERLLTVMRGTASLPQTTLTHHSRMAGSSDSLTRPPGGQYAQHFRSA